MSKRPSEDSQGSHAGKCLKKDVYTAEEVEELKKQWERESSARAATSSRQTLPLLQETFTPNDPVHGLMHLPAIVKIVVDTRNFQRMRHVKQLGICSRVYPGATHDRFFHSIGCAYLAHELVKSLRQRQPDLGVTDRDALCATLAALCHDLGHPCYSHMFEVFVHHLGADKRKAAEQDKKSKGLTSIPEEVEKELCRYETWTHEEASTSLLKGMFEDLAEPLRKAGLRVDEEGDDFACIAELIDPPKKTLEAMMENNTLADQWANVIKGRPVRKAWLYEIVSNWRSGIDIDKFDYFRRDALYLGIHRQFDHNRFLKSVKVVQDGCGVPTISPPLKDKDTLRENMLELRKMLHRAAYQHKTVKKLELHMIDVLKMADETVRVTGVGGRRMRMSEAAIELDPVAYPKLTDTFIESRLLDGENPDLQAAADEYEKRIIRRELMRLVGDWDLPRLGEEGLPFNAGPMPLPAREAVIAGVHKNYQDNATAIYPATPVRPVHIEELRCQVAEFHYGMKAQDPITRLLFHKKTDETEGIAIDSDSKPLRQKVFVFWNPPTGSDDELTLERLTGAFQKWAYDQVELHVMKSPAMKPAPSPTGLSASSDSSAPHTNGNTLPAAAPGAKRVRRQLSIKASCPPNMDAMMNGLLL